MVWPLDHGLSDLISSSLLLSHSNLHEFLYDSSNTQGPLHRLYLCLECSFSQILMWLDPSSLSSHWLKSYLLNDIYPVHPILNCKLVLAWYSQFPSPALLFPLLWWKYIIHSFCFLSIVCFTSSPGKEIFVCLFHLNQRVSHFSVQQNHLEGLLNHTLLDPTTRVSDS